MLGQCFQQRRAPHQLIAVISSDFNRFRNSNVMRAVRLVRGLPCARLLTAKNPKLQRAPASDAPEHASVKLIIVLEFEPVNETIAIGVVMDQVQERLAVEPLQICRSEALPESRVEWFNLFVGRDLSVVEKRIVLRKDSLPNRFVETFGIKI